LFPDELATEMHILAYIIDSKGMCFSENEFSEDYQSMLSLFSFFKKLLLIIYSPPCHPRCPRLSLFSRKEMKVFDENIPGFSPYN